MSQDNARRIFLGEEEIADVSLATFHVFDKETESRLRQGIRVAAGCGGPAAVAMAVAAVVVGAPMSVAAAALMPVAAAALMLVAAAAPCRWLRLQRLRWRLWLGRRLVRNYVLGLCRLHWKLLAMGPVPGSLDQRLLLGTRPRAAAVHTRSAEHEPGPWPGRASGASRFVGTCRSAVDDRRWLVSNELPGALLAHPDREIAIVDVHNRAGHQDLCGHSSGHERGAIDDQNAVCRMRDLEVGK